jgi:cytochrome c551/c552
MKALLGAMLAFTLAACGKAPVTEGDPAAGKLLLRQYGCGTCHHIPGAAAASGRLISSE